MGDSSMQDDMNGDAMETLQSHGAYEDRINQCRKDTDDHLQSIKQEIDSAISDAIQTIKGRKLEKDSKIDQEFDEKNHKLEEKINSITCVIGKNSRIRKINDEIRKNDRERKKLHEVNHTNGEKRRLVLDNRQQELHAEIKSIADEIEKKLGEWEKSWQVERKTTEDTSLGEPPSYEAALTKEFEGTSMNDTFRKPLDEDVAEYITRTVKSLKFIKEASYTGREGCGRIDGYDGEWRLIDTINVQDQVNIPTIIGCLEDKVITSDYDDKHTYELDINTKQNKRVLSSNYQSDDLTGTSCVISCALLNDDKIVCGSYFEIGEIFKGETVTGCISVYDRQWELISNDISLPINSTHIAMEVDIAVDKDGLMVVAQGILPSTKIYRIDPSNGRIINTITSKNIMMRGVLSSGHIIALPWPVRQTVFSIDRQGNQKEIPLWDFPRNDDIYNVCIDPLTDALYVVSLDSSCYSCMIDQVIEGIDTRKRRIASFSLSNKLQLLPYDERKRHVTASSVLMTSSGKIVFSDGDKILVFKKIFTL